MHKIYYFQIFSMPNYMYILSFFSDTIFVCTQKTRIYLSYSYIDSLKVDKITKMSYQDKYFAYKFGIVKGHACLQ